VTVVERTLGGDGASTAQSLSGFMRYLKEPPARLTNRHDPAPGGFFEARYKCVAILVEESLLTTSVYIDLHLVAAQAEATTETSEHASVKHASGIRRLRAAWPHWGQPGRGELPALKPSWA
jgi:hypothetical protein